MVKNLILGPIFAFLTKILATKFFFREFYLDQMLDIVASCNCMQFQEKRMQFKLNKMVKNLILGLIQARWAKIQTANFFLKNLASSVTRYHGQLSSCTISEKTNDPILRKLSARPKDGRTRVISQDAVRLMQSIQKTTC